MATLFKAFMSKRLYRVTLIGVGLLALSITGYLVFTSRPVFVRVAQLEENVAIRVFGLGTVEARVLSRIGFEVGATLVELKADHGDSVKKGEILARLTSVEQQAKVAKAKAALTSAEVSVRKAAANLEKTAAVFAQKQEANRRKQALVGRNVVSEQTAEEAQRDEDVAKADVSVARSEIEVATAMVADARAQLQFEETLLEHRTLTAPYNALVVERHKELGTVVKAGDPIFTLIAADTYWGLAYVDEARSGFIAEGQKVDARLRSRPLDAFTGRVARIGLESDRVSEERRVYVKGDNPPSRVHLGEQAEFWITVAHLDKALLVPEAAVHGYDGKLGKVWTVENGRLQRRVLTFRHRTEESRLEIVAGLPEKAEVVTVITPNLREGRPARILAETQSKAAAEPAK
ncbi:MAG: HlyD family efflux transporter periplasmic adaptor subunit [Hyphomicrobium sp.]